MTAAAHDRLEDETGHTVTLGERGRNDCELLGDDASVPLADRTTWLVHHTNARSL